MGSWTKDGQYLPGKVEAARHEKNLWKRRASSAEIALTRIAAIFNHADQEAGAEGARTDEELLQGIWTIVQDWKEAAEARSSTPLKSFRVKAYIYPLTEQERENAENALDKWLATDDSLRCGVDAVLEAVAELRDPATQRGPGL